LLERAYRRFEELRPTLTHERLDAVLTLRRTLYTARLLDMASVERLLRELGERDGQGRPTLDGEPVEIHAGYLTCRWLGGRPNRVLEEFALRLQHESGCLLADREHGRVVEASELRGLERQAHPTRRGSELHPTEP
jgi:hypothetical protein